MPIIQSSCSTCFLPTHELSHDDLGPIRIVKMSCGHDLVQDIASSTSLDILDSIQWTDDNENICTLRDFQKEDIRRAETADLNCLFAWEQALGKTVAGGAILKLHPELRDCFIFCKGLLKFQWFKKIYEMTGEVAQIFESGKEKPYPGFNIFIISQDLARNLPWLRDHKKKLVIIDEVQNIKSNDSDRTNAIRWACLNAEHVIGMSGTPIKNHAGEYFPILNILKPTRFYKYDAFVRQHVAWTPQGLSGKKLGGLRYPQQFYEDTKDFIFVREAKDVWADLPKVNRMFDYVDLGDLKEAYAKTFDEFQEVYAKFEDPDSAFSHMADSIIVIMNKLKHITGQAKVMPAIDFVSEFFEAHENDNEKLAIFVQHRDVSWLLERGIGNKYGPLTILGEDSPDKRYDKAQSFAKSIEKRVCIASTLGAGEGLDGLQACSKVLFVERQWNAANEEQAEKRFARPGSKAERVDVTYLNVIGTIDELLSTMIEKKRSISRELKDKGIVSDYTESTAMRELAGILARQNREAFKVA